MQKKMSISEKVQSGIYAIGITAVIAFLFYRSFWGMVLLPITWKLVHDWLKKQQFQKRKSMLEAQFMHGMQTLGQSLQAGYSMENAWCEVEKEVGLMYGRNAQFYQHLKDMNCSIRMNVPMEQILLEFAYTSGIEEAINFAELFSYGKRGGGDWKKMIDTIIYRMKERYDTRKEIEVLVAQKQLEQRIMNLMPIGMLAFLQFAAGDYMAVLYHNGTGILCMTICLGIYAATLVLAEKTLQIKV